MHAPQAYEEKENANRQWLAVWDLVGPPKAGVATLLFDLMSYYSR